MYQSLYAQTTDFHLYVFAFDDLTNEILLSLNLDKVTIISLKEFETNELRRVKKERNKAEYCWTCTPSVISYVIEEYNVSECTYVDADLFFYSDPVPLISELDQYKKNVLITEHRFSYLPRLYEEKRAGRFCVQFMTFRNENSSLMVLDKWRRQCIEWCFARYENGKFGDQKYLDKWPDIYQNVHILKHEGGGIAPWNLMKYRFVNDGFVISGQVKKSKSLFPVIFFHFQYVKLVENGSFDVGWYLIPSSVKELFYLPYIQKILETEIRIKNINVNYNTGYTTFRSDSLKNFLKAGLKEKLKYNILKINK